MCREQTGVRLPVEASHWKGLMMGMETRRKKRYRYRYADNIDKMSMICCTASLVAWRDERAESNASPPRDFGGGFPKAETSLGTGTGYRY